MLLRLDIVLCCFFLSSQTHTYKQVLDELCDHDYQAKLQSLEEQLNAARKEIAWLEEENHHLRNEQFNLQHFQCEPKLVIFYTGFKDYDTLNAVIIALKPTAVKRLNETEEHLCLLIPFFLLLCCI